MDDGKRLMEAAEIVYRLSSIVKVKSG